MNKILQDFYIKITATAFLWGLVMIILYNLKVIATIRLDLILWINTLFFILVIFLSMGLRQDMIDEKNQAQHIVLNNELLIIKCNLYAIRSNLINLKSCAIKK